MDSSDGTDALLIRPLFPVCDVETGSFVIPALEWRQIFARESEERGTGAWRQSESPTAEGLEWCWDQLLARVYDIYRDQARSCVETGTLPAGIEYALDPDECLNHETAVRSAPPQDTAFTLHANSVLGGRYIAGQLPSDRLRDHFLWFLYQDRIGVVAGICTDPELKQLCAADDLPLTHPYWHSLPTEIGDSSVTGHGLKIERIPLDKESVEWPAESPFSQVRRYRLSHSSGPSHEVTCIHHSRWFASSLESYVGELAGYICRLRGDDDEVGGVYAYDAGGGGRCGALVAACAAIDRWRSGEEISVSTIANDIGQLRLERGPQMVETYDQFRDLVQSVRSLFAGSCKGEKSGGHPIGIGVGMQDRATDCPCERDS